MSPVSSPLSLTRLAHELTRVRAAVQGDVGVLVGDLKQDSRRVVPGDLFAARPGARSALEFVPDAVRRGAAAVLIGSDDLVGTAPEALGVPVVTVSDIRLGIALAAEAIHGWPSRELAVVGVTGTNGKTTTAWLVEHALRGVGHRAGRLGTIGFALDELSVDSPLTTPEADDVSRYLAQACAAGASHFVLEASSHALTQGRVDGLTFAVAAFSNLTQDHLDYHRDLADYGAAKARLFTELGPAASVLNIDDPFGAELARRAVGRLLTVSRGPRADVHPETVVTDGRGIRGTFVVAGRTLTLESALVGEHNLDNVLLVLGILAGLGLELEAAAASLGRAPAVPGRLERCDVAGDDVIVLVDYAHTPDALERVLAAVRGLTSGELVCLFGCGGDRDPAKRPRMGEAVGRGATRAIVTNDNPRTELPEAIVEMILPGLLPYGIPYEVELDRAVAIERAILGARPGDVVLLAGKGHEPYQIFGTERRAFDDRAEARRALARRRAQGGG